MMSLINKKKILSIFLLLIIGGIFLFLRFPSFVEPVYYLDEGIYAALAHIMVHGGILYKDAFDNKPPSIYFLYMLSRVFWGYQMLPLKICIALLTLLSIFFVFQLTRIWYPKQWILPYMTSFLFVLFTAFEGNVVNAEIIFITFSLGALFLLSNFEQERRLWRYLLAGLLFGIGISFKITAAFDFFAFLLFYCFFAFLAWQDTKSMAQAKLFGLYLSLLSLGASLPLIIYGGYFLHVDAFSYFLNAAFFSNKDYVSYFNNQIGPVTTLTLNGLAACFGLLLVFGSYYYTRKLKRPLAKPFVFLLTWCILATYAAFISGRPYPHYLLQIAPSLAMLLVISLSQFRFVTVLLESFACCVLLLYFNRNDPFSLYKNLLQDQVTYYHMSYAYFLGDVSKNDYQDIFKLNSDGLTAADLQYLIPLTNKYMKNNTDTFYLWGSIPWVDAGSSMTPACRYIDNFDINDFAPLQNETLSCLNQKKPRLIVHEDSNYYFPRLESIEKSHYHEVESLYGNQIRFYLRNQ